MKCNYCGVTNEEDTLTNVWDHTQKKIVFICRNHNPFTEGQTIIIDALTGVTVHIPPAEKVLEAGETVGLKLKD